MSYQGNKKHPRILAPAVHLALRAPQPREVYICKNPPSKNSLFFFVPEKGRFHKRVVFANVPSFRFRSEGTCERTLVPVFVPGEHPNVPSFRFSFQGNIRQNHPFRKPPCCQLEIACRYGCRNGGKGSCAGVGGILQTAVQSHTVSGFRGRAEGHTHTQTGTHTHTHTHTHTGTYTRMLHLPFSDLPLKKCLTKGSYGSTAF